MNPIPLSSPDGIVYAYACGECHNVRVRGESMGIARPGEFASLAAAEQCCRCFDCKAPRPRTGSWGIYCDPCQAKSDAQSAVFIAEREAREAAQDAAHRAATLDYEASLALERLMSEISEECYCAGWLIGLEETLWRFMQAGVEVPFGMGTVTALELNRLRRLHEKCGGWWEHEHFMTTAEWLARTPGEEA